MVRRAAVLALVGFAVSGCGHTKVAHFGVLRVTKTGSVELRRSPAPPFLDGPARNIADVEFLTPALGFLTSSKGQFDHEPGRIQRTTDGGRTWHDVWTGRGAHLAWIAFADRRHGFVGGDRFILRTTDGGVTWRRSPMSIPKRVKSWWQIEPQFVTSTVGFAVTDRASFFGPIFLRTTDGGRRWRPIRGLQDVGDVDFVSPRTGFALGKRLYRTDDGGVTWRALDLPHVPYSLAAVDFLDTRHGFVAGGHVAMTEQPPAQAVFATSDGGHTWQRRHVNPHRGFSAHGGDPFVRLHFVDARRGWATTGLCKCCPNGPCVGGVYVTRDGGYSWRRRGEGAQVTTIGADDAWATPNCDIECDLLWRTTNAGRTWRPIARPDRINFSSVAVRRGVLGLTSYDEANFVSADGGRTWRFGTVGPPPVRARIGKLFYADETCGPSTPFVEAGRTLRFTHNGGRTWNVVNPPLAPASVAVAPDLLVVIGLQSCGAALALSRDGGKLWSLSRIPRACEPSVASGGVIWLACERFFLYSDDAGRSWSRRRAPVPIASIAPAGKGGAWIVAGNGGSIEDKNRLWRTRDGGKTWIEVWPRLPTRG
jgi:photosystem II stability/assembly factor-like uncharacterized protein